MAKKKPRRRQQLRWNQKTGSWLLLFCLAGGILVGLLWLAGRTTAPPPPVPPQVTQTQPTPVTDGVLRQITEGFLETLPVRSSLVQRNLSAEPPRYTVDGAPPDAASLNQFRESLLELSPRLTITLDDDVLVLRDMNRARLLVFFVPPLKPLPKGPQVAIIMDDLGRGLHVAQRLLDIEQPVTFSILPGESHAAQVAQMAHAAHREVLMHAPMEPQGYPAVNPGDDALFLHMSSEEIARRFQSLLDQIPYAVGTNNHMGSRFTEDRRGLEAVMDILRERGLFFVDSLTTARSVGGEVAEAYGVPHLRRDVFLDNVADVEKVSLQIQLLAGKALRNGNAIGICHPYPETLQALQRELPRLAERGITVVPVSQLLAARPTP